jgi:hypothetical protein
MKGIFSLTGMALLGLLVILLFCRVDCTGSKEDNPPAESPCGPHRDIVKCWGAFTGDICSNLSETSYQYSINGDMAICTFTIDAIEDICAHNHIKGSFLVDLLPGNTTEVEIVAEILYGVLYTYPINELEWVINPGADYVTKEAKFNFGMKFLYGDEPGYAFPILKISFQDQGSESENEGFFLDHVIGVWIKVEYDQWKDNSGGAD